MNKRYAIKMTRNEQDFYVFALAQLTNPAWTDKQRDAKTWASAGSARSKMREFRIDGVIVEVVR